MKLAIQEYKRRKYYRSAATLFKKVLNGTLVDYIDRCQGKTIQVLRDESERNIQDQAYTDAITRVYVAVGSDFAKAQVKELKRRKALENIETDFWEEYFKRYAARYAGAKIKSIIGTTEQIYKATVNRIITDNPDKGVVDLLRMIRTDLEGVNRYRAERIARTEVCAASNAGSYEAASQAGVDVMKVWSAILDDRTRDTHAAMHGEVRRMDEPFSNGQMMPGDGSADEVINCRCGVDYITDDDPRFPKSNINRTESIRI